MTQQRSTKSPAIVVDLFSIEARLKRRVRTHLRALGFTRAPDGALVPPGTGKDSFRQLHSLQRREVLQSQRAFIDRTLPSLHKHFASGINVAPALVAPRLEFVESGSWQSELFRLASLTWSIPVSRGYGRRFRVLVWDDFNGKLIGLMALGDPVFNLRARDEWVGWNTSDRKKRLVNVLDAFVLGAVQPYSQLLGGKLVTSLIRTKEIQNEFNKRYGTRAGTISRRRKHPSLVMVTTTSAFGRSSLFNRVTLGGTQILRPVGFTSGFGHFHIPESLFSELRDYLKHLEHPYADGHQFGDGPSWRLRVIREALTSLGMNARLLRHGVEREVFVCTLASNAAAVLRGESELPQFDSLHSVEEIGRQARERWVVPRANRQSSYRDWDSRMLTEALATPSGRRRSAPSISSLELHGARAV